VSPEKQKSEKKLQNVIVIIGNAAMLTRGAGLNPELMEQERQLDSLMC
jgi:hypothetical protein